jgi:hypothetical protein
MSGHFPAAEIAAILDARSRDLGGFVVGRVLPSATRGFECSPATHTRLDRR